MNKNTAEENTAEDMLQNLVNTCGEPAWDDSRDEVLFQQMAPKAAHVFHMSGQMAGASLTDIDGAHKAGLQALGGAGGAKAVAGVLAQKAILVSTGIAFLLGGVGGASLMEWQHRKEEVQNLVQNSVKNTVQNTASILVQQEVPEVYSEELLKKTTPEKEMASAVHAKPARKPQPSQATLPIETQAAPKEETEQEAMRSVLEPNLLLRETALFDRARTAFQRGQWEDARKALQLGDEQFPGGSFAVERQGMLALVALQLRESNAKRRAERFLTQHPQHALADIVRTALENGK